VAGTASAITGGDLAHRVPAAEPGTEAGAVAQALNSMLDRLEVSFAERQRALGEAQASEARMRQFAADASHELRTPLTALRGIAELYRQGAVPADRTAEAFARVEHESQRMGELVEELLLLARLDARRPLAREPVDLLQVCREAVAAVSAGREVALEVLPGSVAPIVAGDAPRLRQVVDNLVANALRHGRGRVTVSVGTDGDSAVISVDDEGPGVPDEDREKVFDRFYRGVADRSRDTGGSGLGLSIVAAIMAAHGGSVQLDGAAFTARMPLVGRE
jgi:two-component system OmpR family sensor kinase